MNVTLMKFIALILGFALWAALGYLGKVPLDPLIALLQMGLGGLITHMLQDPGAPAPQVTTGPPADTKAQGGFASIRLLTVVLALALVAACSTGCASLTQAGNTGYSIEPTAGGCKFNATDGKEFSSRSLAMTSSTEGCQLMVQEGASSAFQGQAIAGKALSLLPSFAAPILSPGPAVVVPQLMQPAAPAEPPGATGKAL